MIWICRCFLRFVLEQAGFTIACCSNSTEADVFLASATPDLIITDLMMENLDEGFAFAQRLKGVERLAGLPVIMLTAIQSQRGFDFAPHSQEELADMGVDAFLAKPVTPQEIRRQVCALLGIAPR